LQLFGLILLYEFKREHATARGAIDAWIFEVRHADWTIPQDIKNRYKSADFLAGNRVIFNTKGNSFRLVVKVDYVRKIVMAEWVGTHAAYNKKRFG